tara:strand:- start:329 stop:700 length:372 start_codon:yes stop_codon:yes gene_type:complete
MDQSGKRDINMSYKDLIMYYHTSIRNTISSVALAIAIIGFGSTTKIKKNKQLFRCLLLIAISLLVISVYNNLLMRKILFTFKEKDDYYDNFEIEGFITISNIFYIIDTVLILVGLYILYKSFF